DRQPRILAHLLLESGFEHVLGVRENGIHANMSAGDRDWRETRGFNRTGEQQVLSRRRLEQSVVGNPKDRPRAGYQIRDADSWAELVFVHKQLVVVEANANVESKVFSR